MAQNMKDIINQLQALWGEASKSDDAYDNYFEEQVSAMEDMIADFSARYTKYKETDWAYENKCAHGDYVHDQGRE